MNKYLIITEKPSARKNFEKALGGKSGEFQEFTYELTNLRGHVVTLAPPEKQVPENLSEKYSQWDLKYLPWDLKQFKWQNTYIKTKNPKTNKVESTKPLLDSLKRTVDSGSFDALVIATDTDPSGEGELLAWEAILAIGWTGKVLRANFMDESTKSIKKALANLSDVSDISKDGDFQKGVSRSRWDYASMQLTRVATIVAKQQGYNLVARQGRLKSAMMLKVYQQLEAIKNYKRIPFFEVRFQDEYGNTFKRSAKDEDQVDFRFTSIDEANEDLRNFNSSEVIIDDSTMKSQKPPKLLDLSSLSALLSKEGFDAGEVLATYQSMYENQIVSYPRTEDKTITPEQFEELLPLVDSIANLIGVDPAKLTHRVPRNSHVKAEGAHGANRPGTSVPVALDELTKYGPSGPRIYEILARNYLAMLAEDYQYEAKKAHINDYPNFMAILNIPIQLNWKNIYLDEESQQESVKQIGKTGEPFIYEGQNKKPTQPTWSWLKTFLEKNDIGTGATRTSTYAELSSGKQAYLKDKKGKISLTQRGAISAYLVQGTFIADPAITKRVFDIFNEVGQFKLSTNHSLDSITKTVIHDMPIIQENATHLTEIFGKPDKDLAMDHHSTKEKISGKWQGKDINFNRTWGKHTFTDNEVETLLSGESITFTTTSKSGKSLQITGKLGEQIFKGNKFVGFKKQ